MQKTTFINLMMFLLLCFTSQAQMQSPEEFLKFKKGDRFLRHHQVVSYYEYVAAQNPSQVKLIQYGSTNEGRPLIVAVVASPENFASLEEIRTNNLKSIGLLDGKPSSRKQPAIAWMSYNVHGNESCGTNTAPFVIHELLNPNSSRSKAILANTVVILDPSINPDGYDRYANWYNQKVGARFNANAAAWEHQEPWPGGRFNHYIFDLNRDWAWQVQKESQERMALYRQWMPQLHADFHEQGVESPYYFSPAAKPYHEDITAWQREFQKIIGDYNKKDFDKNGWLYFSKERFDLLYPSYGDTYPTYNGAFGMTYEQGGSGRAGLGIVKRDGDTLTLKQRIDHHFSTSFACLDAISANADKAVNEFVKFHDNTSKNPIGPYKSYVIKTKGEEARVKEFLNYLDKEGFQYGVAGKDYMANGYSYHDDKSGFVKVEAEDVVFNLYQPRSMFLKILMEPKTMVEDSMTYDITSWSLPYAYGLKAYALKDRLNPTAKANFENKITKTDNAYAYLARWQSFTDLKFLSAIMQKGIKVRSAAKSFEMEGQTYPAGTLVITRTGNERLGAQLEKILTDEATKLGVGLTAVTTGMATKGSDFGSENVVFLKMPKVATVAGEGISTTGFGEVWHFFDQQIQYPITVLPENTLGSTNLSQFDVLILPGGNYNRILNESTLGKIKEWVRNGGRLIAIENALKALAGKEGFELKVKEDEKKKESDESKLKIYGNAERESISEETPGSIYRVTMDTTHPLAFGYGNTYFSLVLEGASYQYLNDGWNVGITKSKDLIAGFAGVKAQEKLKNSLIWGVQDMGRGNVVYLANNPLFRGFWQNGKLLFGNAVFVIGN
ncbi:M14 family metallopeptidase [Flectobacillus sp. DC10W]|uniref:M14 family metallopeptidase n=1 Tax=Flectobacillus longus TaxID=2984207 RepID=A0ABT6YRU3_9BACT|nr:M14 family metallopeptidase [Flectobacillus longus]MDI9866317.1 M14 family metallopeptidase [Flectobacillus longus]